MEFCHWILIALACFTIFANVTTGSDISSILWPVIAIIWCVMHAMK